MWVAQAARRARSALASILPRDGVSFSAAASNGLDRPTRAFPVALCCFHFATATAPALSSAAAFCSRSSLVVHSNAHVCTSMMPRRHAHARARVEAPSAPPPMPPSYRRRCFCWLSSPSDRLIATMLCMQPTSNTFLLVLASLPCGFHTSSRPRQRFISRLANSILGDESRFVILHRG